MNSLARPPRLREKVKHIINSTMLCCGRRKESRGALESQAEEGVRRAGPSRPRIPHGQMPEMVIQSDFRKVSGISTEIFRQIEAVENDFDATTAAHLETVEKRGEMVIRLLDPCSLGRAGAEAYRKYLTVADSTHIVQFVEIIKRPGQTLGLYIREGDGIRTAEGVFISRIALESAVYNSGLLKVGDEILAVNLVDVRRMSLDDVVIIMSIPRRLVLTIRSRICGGKLREVHRKAPEVRPPIVVVKKGMEEEGFDEGNSNSENGVLIRARTKGLPADVPPVAVVLEDREPYAPEDLYYNSQPRARRHEEPWIRKAERRRHPPPHHPPPPHRPPIVTRQPKVAHTRYPKTLEGLAEQVHTFYRPSAEPRRPPQYPQHPMMYPRAERSTTARHRYWDEHGATLRRSTGMLRTESEQRIPTTEEPYDSRSFRRSFRVPPTMQHRGRLRRYDDSRNVGILRRRSVIESSSDTEVQSGGAREFLLARQRSLGRATVPRSYGHGRSNSLPRARTSLPDHRRHRQSVRFEKTSMPYDSQEDSDGAVSAPELPATRSGRRGGALYGRSPSVFTSAEYRAWLSRAPSTSAIYERIRRGKSLRQAQHLPRIAHSAESLLDSIRQQKKREEIAALVRGYEKETDGDADESALESDVSKMDIPSPTVSEVYRALDVVQRFIETKSDVADSLAELYAIKKRIHDIEEKRRPHGLDFLHRRPFMHTSSDDFLLHSSGLDYIRHVPHPTPVKPSEDRLHLLTLNPNEFMKYRPEKESEAVLGGAFSGMLWLHVLAGRGLRPTTHGDHFRDLYCVIECDRAHKARTVVRTGEHNFDWDEIFEVDVVDNAEIAFLVYSWDPLSRHKLCYKGTIHLMTLLRESPVHSLALKMEPRGTLYLKLRYRDPRQTFQRTPAHSDSGLFGVDMETVMLREDSGYTVPLIIRRCVEEVERRGLEVVGIYRLCGSAIRKKMLRDGFERNALLVDVSVDSVPDINVVTSLLKDYLRELPEPVFTRGLFDMLVDGLGVCLSDDPEGNAKLMFSILECLPKVYLCTVLLLMDHLKLVTTHSDRNKMTPQSLAVSFGPALMCHTETGAPVTDMRKPIEVLTFLLEIWPVNRGRTQSVTKKLVKRLG